MNPEKAAFAQASDPRSLGDVIAGLTHPDSGRFHAAGRDLTRARPAEVTAAGVGVVPEDRHRVAAIVEMSLTENLFLNRTRAFTRFGLMRRGAMRAAAEEQMARFDVRAAGPDVTFGSLSGGNQQKAVLARELTTPDLTFLLAAQPTGVNVYLFAQRYGTAQALASTTIFLSTAFSIFSLPVVLYLFGID